MFIKYLSKTLKILYISQIITKLNHRIHRTFEKMDIFAMVDRRAKSHDFGEPLLLKAINSNEKQYLSTQEIFLEMNPIRIC